MRTVGALLIASCLAFLSVDARASDPTKATSSKEARLETVRAIPFSRMKAGIRKKIDPIVRSPSIYRRLPVQVFDCDRDMYLFLIRYPEVIVNMWELMGATKVTLDRTGAYAFTATDGAGTDCSAELVYGTRNQHVFYAEGTYEGPILKRKIKGRCVLVVTTGYANRNNRDFVSHRLDVFLQIDNIGAELLARTLHPLVGKSADHNFSETTKFIGQVSQAARRNGAGLQRLSHRLKRVQSPIRDQFSRLAMVVNSRGNLQERPQPQSPATPSSQDLGSQPLLPGARRNGPELRR